MRKHIHRVVAWLLHEIRTSQQTCAFFGNIILKMDAVRVDELQFHLHNRLLWTAWFIGLWPSLTSKDYRRRRRKFASERRNLITQTVQTRIVLMTSIHVTMQIFLVCWQTNEGQNGAVLKRDVLLIAFIESTLNRSDNVRTLWIRGCFLFMVIK